jgi:hypothetical protein
VEFIDKEYGKEWQIINASIKERGPYY